MLEADFDRAVEGLEWEELISILRDAINEMLSDTLNSAPPSLPLPHLPPVPAGKGFDTSFQPESLIGGYSECIRLGAVPLSLEQPSPLTAAPGLNVEQLAPIIYQGPPLYNQNIMHCQGQYLPNQCPVHYAPMAAAPVRYPAAPAHPYNNVPVVNIPEGQSLRPVGMLNGEAVYMVEDSGVTPSDSVPPPLNTSVSKKRKRENQQDDDRPYVKRPPNAFMLYMKEQRPNVVAELNIKESAAVNTILGQRWKSLSDEEQAKYFDQANKERLLHAQRHPDWSSADNYGKKRKRQKSKAPIKTEASASKPEDITHQAKKLCVTPVQTVEMEPSPSQTDLIEAPLTQTVLVQLKQRHLSPATMI